MKILLLLSSLIICLTTFSQNVGIGTTTPTNQLHVLSPIPTSNPLRVENLKQSNNPYDGILVTDNSGVIRYIPSSLILNDSLFSSKLDSVLLSDSTFIKGLIDSLTVNNSFRDSILSFINDSAFIRSLDSLLLSDSIFITGIRDSLLSDTTFLNYLDSLDDDEQTLSISGSNLTISNGNTIVIPSGADDQNLTLGAGTATTSILDMENGSDVTLVEGTNIQLTESGNSLTITATGDGTGTDDQNLTLGAGTATTSILDMENGTDVTLVEGTNIQLTESGNSLTISATGGGTDDQNLTLGAGTATTSILDMENGSDVTLVEGTNIQLTESGNSLTITATGDGTGTDDQNLTLGAGSATTSVLNMENGTDVTLVEGTNIQLTESGNSLTITATGDGTGTDDQNLTLGAGSATTSVLNMENGTDVTLVEGTNIQLTESGNSLTITATGDGTGTDDQNLTVSPGAANSSVLNMENGSDVTILTNDLLTISETGSTITIGAPTISSGSYNPTYTRATGTDPDVLLDASYSSNYIRVGNIVHVTGKVDIEYDGVSSAPQVMLMTLPIASNFTATNTDVTGTITRERRTTPENTAATITADITTNQVAITMSNVGDPGSTSGSFGLQYSFMYVIK